jgi:electron transport complex protein RnfG
MGRLIISLAVACFAAAFGLALVNAVTEAPIAEQRRLEVLRAVEETLPPFDNDPVGEALHMPVIPPGEEVPETVTVYVGERGEEPTGVAFAVKGEGYGGFITVMLGVDLQGVISGIQILEHLETPGLGANIEKSSFTVRFKGKSLENSRLVAGNLAVINDGGDIDALTGATISPRGVAAGVSWGLKIFSEYRGRILEEAREGPSPASTGTEPGTGPDAGQEPIPVRGEDR